MKILIVGAGASGIVAAINYKRNHTNDDVLIIEHLDKPLKKLLATGNGRCNLGNANLDVNNYSNASFVKNILKEYNYESFFETISVKTKVIDGLVYPYSESALTVKNALLNEAAHLGVNIKLEEKLLDYRVGEKIEVTTSKSKYLVDRLYIATALKSSPNLGSDGSILSILEKHGYQIKNIYPALCPIKVSENTKLIDGIRNKTNVKIYQKGKIIFDENGEVLFKKNGLSGIVIFNASRVIANANKKVDKIVLDLLPNITQNEIENFCKLHSVNGFLQGFFNPKLGEYLRNRFTADNKLIAAVKKLEFTFQDFYDFEFSQISVGGLNIDELKPTLESKKEKGVFFIGEVLDIDGPCGGYNLTWAFASALYSTK